MLKDITIGQYYKADSVVHRMDPRIKILLSVWLIVVIFICKNVFSFALMFSLVLISILFSKVPLKMYLKSLKPIIPIVIFTCIINLFYLRGGDVLLQFWKIKITEQGVQTGVFMSLRIITLIMASSILTYTTVPAMLTDAIEKLLSPLKKLHVDVHSLAMMMTLALRFIPLLIDEIERITNAQKARGADFESGNILSRIKALIPILIPLFVSAFSRAYELAFAMSCRCYTGGEGRTSMKKMKMSLRDLWAVLFYALFTAGIILLNIYVKVLTF